MVQNKRAGNESDPDWNKKTFKTITGQKQQILVKFIIQNIRMKCMRNETSETSCCRFLVLVLELLQFGSRAKPDCNVQNEENVSTVT